MPDPDSTAGSTGCSTAWWLACALMWPLGCKEPISKVPPESDRDETSRIEPVVPDERDERYVGVISVGESLDVSARVPGKLEEVHVRAGDRVHAGDPIATIDDREARQELRTTEHRLDSERAALEEARVRVEEAQRELLETKELVASGAAASASVEDARFALRRAEASAKRAAAAVQESRGRVSQLSLALGETTIEAPFAGTVAERYLEPGAVVQVGTPVVRLLSGDMVWLDFAVPPHEVSKLAKGQRVVVDLEDPPRVFAATIHQIAPEVDAASGLVFVEAELDVEEGERARLQRGTPARVRPPEAPAPEAPAPEAPEDSGQLG